MALVIILIRPQMGENIGAVARAMSNFGLSELRIVSPRDGWPNPKAIEMAAGGKDIVNNAKIYDSFTSSMADVHIAYATTARPRDINKMVVTPSQATTYLYREIHEDSSEKCNCALVFGPERSGLENEEITLCDAIINIPTDKKNSSLNLAQSSVIIGYEWMKVCIENEGQNIEKQGNKRIIQAPKLDMFDLFNQLEGYLDKAEYFRTEQRKPIMWQSLKNMLLRGSWSEQEVRSFRGMIRSLWERSR